MELACWVLNYHFEPVLLGKKKWWPRALLLKMIWLYVTESLFSQVHYIFYPLNFRPPVPPVIWNQWNQLLGKCIYCILKIILKIVIFKVELILHFNDFMCHLTFLNLIIKDWKRIKIMDLPFKNLFETNLTKMFLIFSYIKSLSSNGFYLNMVLLKSSKSKHLCVDLKL